MPPFPLSHVLTNTGETKENKIAFQHIFIDQLELPPESITSLEEPIYIHY
jgi:hypothetical protein